MTAKATGLHHVRALVASEAGALGVVVVVLLLVALFRQLVFAAIGAEVISAATFAASVGDDVISHFFSALVMMAIIQPVRRFGPPSGARRVGWLLAATAVAAALAATVRSWLLLYGGYTLDETWSGWPLIFGRFAILAGLLVTIGEFYRAELRSLVAMHSADADRAALEQQTLQARLKTLEAQIEPHFLFNTLANVRRLYETDAMAGDAMLERLMRYLEVALPSMRGERSTLEREARVVEDYLELQCVRMGRRLSYRVDIPSALSRIEVPPMMLLTLVENSVKHGLAPQREGGRIDVGARIDGVDLRLEVADTGRGFGGDPSGGGTGLANIRARLAAMFGGAAEFTLTPRDPCGLLATIRMPLGGARGTT